MAAFNAFPDIPGLFELFFCSLQDKGEAPFHPINTPASDRDRFATG